MTEPRSPYLVVPGTAPGLAARLTDGAGGAPGDKHATRAATKELVARIGELQEKLWACADRRVLVVLQGMDTSGKGGAIDHVFADVQPAGLRVVSFKAPSSTELSRDYLWRIHANVPSKGELAVFDRSHYEDVIAVRVLGLLPEARWRRRYAHLVEFERMLVDEGTVVVKVFLHISKEEQRERLQARLDEPEKHWKFRLGDLDARRQWDDYQAAFEEAIEQTSTDHAPWHVVPADRKWVRDWVVATIVVEALEAMDLDWPAATEDLSGVVIE